MADTMFKLWWVNLHYSLMGWQTIIGPAHGLELIKPQPLPVLRMDNIYDVILHH